MKKIPLVILIFFEALSISCSNQKATSEGEKYETIVYYEDNTNRLRIDFTERNINKNKLYLFFETYYSSDTITIQVNNEVRTTLLNTDESIGLAKVIEYEDINAINLIEIKKNNGKPLVVEINEKWKNKWALNFYQDTLRANVLNYAPAYE